MIANRKKTGKARKGMALVLVLAVLVLLTVLVVGFLSRAMVERRAAAGYANSQKTQQLADLAVGTVQAQIDHATRQTDGNRPAPWASQPGMVRTFEQNGSLKNAYRLYSSEQMISSEVDLDAEVTAMDGWSAKTAHFVDLNAPVAGQEGGSEFPIVDGRVADGDVVEGFEVTGAPGATASQPVPMPVKWLYVLQDGQMVAPTGGGDTTATITGASETNPIVGRVAFWTDDESSKLNVNTAAHGFFWDIPRAFSVQERDQMARKQPTLYEYQRYPGHPATTSLWPVLGNMLGYTQDATDGSVPYAFAEDIYGIIPRVEDGGSRGGQDFATDVNKITPDSDRLYTTIDELAFKPDRSSQLTREQLEQAKFFLTARNNSPEVNMFGLPRIAIWPINSGNKKPSELDKMIAFCSTMGTAPYYFQRENSRSNNADLSGFSSRNARLFSYLDQLTASPVPGFGNNSFLSKYGKNDQIQILTQIFDYIRSSNTYSTALGADAYTGPAAITSRGSGAGQVTPTVHTYAGNKHKGFGRFPMLSRAVVHFFVSGLEGTAGSQSANPGQVYTYVPPYIKYSPGRSNSTNNNNLNADINYANQFATFLKNVGVDGEIRLKTSAIVYFDTFEPSAGYAFPRYNFTIDVEFEGAWTVNSESLGLSGKNETLDIRYDTISGYEARDDRIQALWFGRYLGGNMGPNWLMQNYSSLAGNYANSTAPNRQYPLVSDRVEIHPPYQLVWRNPVRDDVNTATDAPITERIKNATLPQFDIATNVVSGDKYDGTSYTENVGTMNFSGGTVRAIMKVDGEEVQEYEFEFPSFTKPLPMYAPELITGRRPSGSAGPRPYLSNTPAAQRTDMFEKQAQVGMDFRFRWRTIPQVSGFSGADGTSYGAAEDAGTGFWRYHFNYELLQIQDVVVSLEPAFGDKRILAARTELTTDTGYNGSGTPSGDFVVHKDYRSTSMRMAADITGYEPYGQDRKALSLFHERAPGRILGIPYGTNAMPDITSWYNSFGSDYDSPEGGVVGTTTGGAWPDFDNGTLHLPDDAYINRADEGSTYDTIDDDDVATGRRFSWYNASPTAGDFASFNKELFFSPNRQMPSAAMFGSLPTGVFSNRPWETLLFRPDPGGPTASATHRGAQSPGDHLLLDLFWMPVVDPYAISEPFSSNGKVNLNYQIAPFKYMHRSTALRGVLHSQKVMVIPNTAGIRGNGNEYDSNTGYGTSGSNADEYKDHSEGNVVAGSNLTRATYRQPLNLDRQTGTLRAFENLFNDDRILISETEICNMPLVPLKHPSTDNSGADVEWSANFESDFWDKYRLTGDNSREIPYAHILPRVTTRSNTYTVHYRVQALRKSPMTAPNEWDEARDQVVAESRGSRTVERYIDPNDPDIPDYANEGNLSNVQRLDEFYRWRVLYNRQFNP